MGFIMVLYEKHGTSSLDRALGEAADEAALDERNRRVAGRAPTTPPAASSPHSIWYSPMRVWIATVTVTDIPAAERQRIEIFVPRGDEDVDAGRNDARHRQRQDDAAQAPQPRAAIDHRRLVEAFRDGADIARQHPHGEGDRHGGIGEDQAEMGVEDADLAASARRAAGSAARPGTC